MQMDYTESQYENELLNNSLLFSAIRKNKTPEEKIRKIKKYLERGANVNASDANNKCNTPLHVAVIKEELQVVNFLLQRGATVTSKNSYNQTPLDIARLSNACIKTNIVTILERYNSKNLPTPSCEETNEDFTTLNTTEILKTCDIREQIRNNTHLNDDSSLIKIKKENEYRSKQESKKDLIGSIKSTKVFQYQKRSGTSGLSGQLYETKLLGLILFRALYVQKVNKFFIATNVEGMGAFDDIIFRYCSDNINKHRIMFIQAKHRDNPKKDKITVEEIMKANGDFSLHKYLESYIKIIQTFNLDNNDDMFRGEYKNIDCDFIIYTSAFENFKKIKPVERNDGQCFITTNSDGKIFRFDYDDQDVEFLVQIVAKSRAELLAKKLSKFILKDNYTNMMADDLIKTYHVFLAQHVIAVKLNDTKSQSNFLFARFRDSFFTSNDGLLLAFKDVIYNELMHSKNKLSEKSNESENILKSLRFKVPTNFGNFHFSFNGSKQKQQRRLDYLCSKFQNLYDNAENTDVVKIDDNMVGPNKILQSTDIEPYRLGGLVGNLLILDEITNTLKFNNDKGSLSDDNLKLYEKLTQVIAAGKNLTKLRFDVNVYRFPRLSLLHDEYDKKLVKDFLNKLIFYTNQAVENEVENVLKKEIDTCFFNRSRQSDGLFRIKSNAIFLKVHDWIQKWWKHPNKAPYLTDSCEFFFQAEQDIINNPLLTIFNFTYIKTIKSTLNKFEFKDIAVQRLELDQFISGKERILNIISEENALSSIKVIQYFKNNHYNNYTFVNMDYIKVGGYIEDVKIELKKSKINILILVCTSGDLIPEIVLFKNIFKGKVIIVSTEEIKINKFETVSEKIIRKVDNQNGFADISDSIREILLQEINVVYQGKEVPLAILFKNRSDYLINSNVLYKLINNEKIIIGTSFNNQSYDEILDFYINEKICCYITLETKVHEIVQLNVIKYNEIKDDFYPDSRDIVLITDKYDEFLEFINRFQQCNVHWFIDEENLVWRKSRGELVNIIKYIHRGSHEAYTWQPTSLKDLQEKVVIISAEPGMGKSSLLTHLAIHTKQKHPNLWISKINLLENINVFRNWKHNNVKIDLKEAAKFLFGAIGFEACKELQEKQVGVEGLIDQVSTIGDNIAFARGCELNLAGVGLLEIQLFIHSFNNGQVAILLDGFDEICPDFATEIIQLVKILKMSKVTHLWITSRSYNVLDQLENALETFSFTIQPLSFSDQLEFLEKIWSRQLEPKKLEEHPFKEWGMQHVIKGFLSVLSAVLCDGNDKFISIPLHLYMIAEVYQDSFYKFPVIPENLEYFIRNENTVGKINLNQLYERFVEVKFCKIRFGEKKPFLCINDPDIRKLIDTERTNFYYIHKKLATFVVFIKSCGVIFFNENDIKEIYDFIDRIMVGEEKTGIIVQVNTFNINDYVPKFVHFTFAEYFATELLCDRIISLHCGHSMWMMLIRAEWGVRRFFNAKLGNYPHMFEAVSKTDTLSDLYEALILQDHLNKLLFITIDECLENLAIFILKCIKSILTKDNLSEFINALVTKNDNESCIACVSIKHNAIIAVSFIIEMITDIDIHRLADLFHCSDVPEFNSTLLALGAAKDMTPNAEMLDILLSKLPPLAIIDMFTIQYNNARSNISFKTLIHVIANAFDHKYFQCFDKALKKLNNEQLIEVFNAKDPNGKMAAHYAAENQCYSFFYKLDDLVDRRTFKAISMSLDNSGLTPIHYFNFKEDECDMLKVILEKVYESNTNAMLTLDYFISKNNNV